MDTNYKIKTTSSLAWKLAKYNISIIFANKFIWFFIASLALMLFFSVQNVLENDIISEDTIYSILLLPGILLVFYPTVFGIQSDEDASVIEILFGIPNYRYKVWLTRLVMVFIVVFVMLLLYSYLLSILLIPVNQLEMTYQIMYPVAFIGSLSFMFSTLIRNGNGTAVVMVLLGLFVFILGDSLDESKWNVFLNPFSMPNDTSEMLWTGIVSDNRIILGIGIVVSMIYGLFNLQKREKFM